MSGPDNGAGAASPSHQNDAYSYNSLGNLLTRGQLISTSGASMTESFGYDNLNRLTSSQVGGQAAKAYGYDSLGNLTSKAGVGSYTYPASGAASVRPHAVSSIAGSVAGLTNPAFGYDANGNLLDGLGRHFTWSSGNDAVAIDKLASGVAVQRTSFLLGPEHERVRQSVSPMSAGVPGAPTSTIYYGPGLEKEIDAVAGTTTIRTYVAGLGYVEEKFAGTGLPSSSSGTRNARYFLADHQHPCRATLTTTWG